MTNRLSVWWDGRISGCLYLGPDGETLFAYDAAWLADPKAPPLSFSLPKQPEPFNRSAVQAFFGGILPEEGQRTAIAPALGVSADNDSGCSNSSAQRTAGSAAHYRAAFKPAAQGHDDRYH